MRLATALLTASLAAAADPAAIYLANARKALETRNFEQAKIELHLAVQANPQSADAWLMLAGAEIQNGESARAIEHFERALRLAPDSFSGHYNLALAYLHGRNLGEARRELERAVTLSPNQPDAVYNLGMVLLEMHQAREAVQYFQRARSLEPGRPDVAFNLVRAELAAGDWPAARDEARHGAPTFAADAGWHGSVGKLFLESGHAQDALPLLQDALRLQPAAEELRHLLASTYLQSQQPDLLLALFPQPKTSDEHFLCGSALLIQHHFAAAESEAGGALEKAPNEPRYLLLAARIQQFQGHQAQALELLRRAAGQAPRWAEPYYCMAVSYYYEHRYDDARRALDESLQRTPDSSRSLFLFGVTLVNQGKNREAEDYLHRAIAMQPNNARYRFHLGTAQLRAARPTEAQEAFRQAIRLKPDYALPHYELGKLLLHAGRPHDALPELEAAIRYEPGLVQAYYQLSRVAAALGQREKSSQALATFNRLRKQETDERQRFSEDVNGELQRP